MTAHTIFNRTWCRDCYGRREPWVLRLLEEHGVLFERTVLRRDEICQSCRDPLAPATPAVAVRYPEQTGADRVRGLPVAANRGREREKDEEL